MMIITGDVDDGANDGDVSKTNDNDTTTNKW